MCWFLYNFQFKAHEVGKSKKENMVLYILLYYFRVELK